MQPKLPFPEALPVRTGKRWGCHGPQVCKLVWYCVLCLRSQVQRAIEISTPMLAHMPPTYSTTTPCQHHQDTHKQETTHTLAKISSKRHRATSKIPPKHNSAHTRTPKRHQDAPSNKHWDAAGFAPRSTNQDAAKSPLTRCQYTAKT